MKSILKALMKALTVLGAMALLFVLLQVLANNFLPPPAPPREGKARSNLKAAATAAWAYIQETDHYSPLVEKIGFSPERGNRYAFFLAATGPVEDRTTQSRTQCPDCTGIGVDTFRYGADAAIPSYAASGCPLTTTSAAAEWPGLSNIGVRETGLGAAFLFAAADKTYQGSKPDCWSIASHDRLDDKGRLIPARVPFHEQQGK